MKTVIYLPFTQTNSYQAHLNKEMSLSNSRQRKNKSPTFIIIVAAAVANHALVLLSSNGALLVGANGHSSDGLLHGFGSHHFAARLRLIIHQAQNNDHYRNETKGAFPKERKTTTTHFSAKMRKNEERRVVESFSNRH